MSCMNYLGILIGALTFENGGKFMAATYYLIPAILFVFLGFSRTFNLVGRANKVVKAMEADKAKSE